MANFKLQPTKIKGKQKIKLGKLNLDISGSLRNNSVVNAISNKKPKNALKGSKLKASASYNKGNHSISGEANYRPDTNEGTVAAGYKYKFSEGGQVVADQYKLIGEE
tara:strand:+ start:2072 stop:2392 length:321 start_codon:yes stop_codon:yes gene_type:complete